MAIPNNFTTALRYAATSISLSIFPLLSTIVAPLLLTMVPQGQELLDMVASDQIRGDLANTTTLLHFVLFQLAFLAWGFSNWYGSRVLLQYDFVNPLPEGQPWHLFINRWNAWQPRVLGFAGMALIAGYVTFVHGQWLAGGITSAVVVLFAAFIIKRRSIVMWIGTRTGTTPPVEAGFSRPELRPGDRLATWLGVSCSFVLLFALAHANHSFARTLGSPVILFLALASIVLTCSVVLAYMPLSRGWPNLAWTPLVVALVLGATPLTRNHRVAPRVIASADWHTDARPSVVDDFRAWTERREAAGRAGNPIYLVATEGGASRSAWWTAHVLSTLDYASHGEFSWNVYAISGVSGGSLGAAAFVGLVAERAGQPPAFSHPLAFPNQRQCWDMRLHRDEYPTPMQAECFLGEDFLSTTLGYLLYADLFQRIFPAPVQGWDRSLGLELSWQKDWAHLFNPPPSPGAGRAVGKFSDTLDALYNPGLSAYPQIRNYETRSGPRRDLPLLLLNTTAAVTGRSALQAPVRIPSTEIDDVFDARLNTRGLPLSAIVHNSARFPLVSPGGEVQAWTGNHWDTLVDGGYFENSGAATLAELIRVLREAEPVKGKEPLDDYLDNVRVIFIMNDPSEKSPKAGLSLFAPLPDERAAIPDAKAINQEEVMTPIAGLYNTRSARADSAKRLLLFSLAGEVPARQRVTEIFLKPGIKAVRKIKGHEKDRDPSMSWYLNPASRRNMWAAIGEESTYKALCGVVTEVGGNCALLPQLVAPVKGGDR